PASLMGDVRRHGVEVRGVDINASAARASLENSVQYAPVPPPSVREAGLAGGGPALSGGKPVPGQPAIRLGLASVRNLGTEAAEAIAAGRPYADLADFARRTRPPAPSLAAPATPPAPPAP